MAIGTASVAHQMPIHTKMAAALCASIDKVSGLQHYQGAEYAQKKAYIFVSTSDLYVPHLSRNYFLYIRIQRLGRNPTTKAIPSPFSIPTGEKIEA